MKKSTENFYEIINNKAKAEVDILLYGGIPTFDENYNYINTVGKFLEDFKKLESANDRINIRINSPGGSIYHGIPIFNAIANSKKDIHTYNDGLAASMAGIILLAGKTVHSAKNSLLMIHNANSFVQGNSKQLKEHADILDKYDDLLSEHFADKSGKAKADIQARFFSYKDTFLTAKEAKNEGFIDEIEDYDAQNSFPQDVSNLTYEQVLNYYKPKEPEKNWLAAISSSLRDFFSPEKPATLENLIDSDMKISTAKNILASMGLPEAEIKSFVDACMAAEPETLEPITEEDVTNKVNDAVSPLNASIGILTQEKETLIATVEELTQTVNSYKASGVIPTTTKGEGNDPIPGTKTQSISETDSLVAEMRLQAGLTN